MCNESRPNMKWQYNETTKPNNTIHWMGTFVGCYRDLLFQWKRLLSVKTHFTNYWCLIYFQDVKVVVDNAKLPFIAGRNHCRCCRANVYHSAVPHESSALFSLKSASLTHVLNFRYVLSFIITLCPKFINTENPRKNCFSFIMLTHPCR